jgi:branched-chain amino acid aminotransferase
LPEPVAYLNDRFLPQSQAGLALNDAGFVMGATVTDLCRTFRRRPFRLEDHLRRFRVSCSSAEIGLEHQDAEIIARIDGLIERNAGFLAPEGELAIVLFATPGPIGYYLGEPGGPGDGKPTFGIHTFPLPLDRYRRLFTEGARLIIPAVRQVSGQSVSPSIKQRSRLHWWLAEREARRADPFASALLLDADGFVTETAAANLLLVIGGEIVIPPRKSVLGGVSLALTCEIAEEIGIPVVERPVTADDCRFAAEAILTSTSFCIAGVRSVDGCILKWPGPIYERLQSEWNARAGFDLRRQILSNQ